MISEVLRRHGFAGDFHFQPIQDPTELVVLVDPVNRGRLAMKGPVIGNNDAAAELQLLLQRKVWVIPMEGLWADGAEPL